MILGGQNAMRRNENTLADGDAAKCKKRAAEIHETAFAKGS